MNYFLRRCLFFLATSFFCGQILAAEIDQELSISTAGASIIIGGPGGQVLAQVVTAGISGELVQVDVPIFCNSGDLEVEVQGVMPVEEGVYVPDNLTITEQLVSGENLPPYSDPSNPSFRPVVFVSPAMFADGDMFSVVFRSAGACVYLGSDGSDLYAGGDGWYTDLTHTDWRGISGAMPADLPFRTWVEIDVRNKDVTFTPLGDLPGGDFDSRANAVSADGAVVVGDSSSSSMFEGFRWTRNEGMEGLGIPAGSLSSSAIGLSADGSVIVGYLKSLFAFNAESFLWTGDGGIVGLGHFPGGNFSLAYDVTADGLIVVGLSNDDSIPNIAFRWTSDGGMVGLGEWPGGGLDSSALGVSADGTVIVGYGDSSSGSEAFRWTSDGGLEGLGLLAGGSYFPYGSGAQDVSADGTVIVGWSSSSSSGLNGVEAFRWTSDGGMVGLGYLPECDSSEAFSASEDGLVIVGVCYSLPNDQAFLWTEAGGMVSVASILTSSGVNLTGWVLERTSGVSADGSIIVGWGKNPGGYTEAWLADIGAAPAMQVAVLFDDVSNLDLRKSVSHSLESALRRAISPLQDDDASNDATATRWLELFITRVESQRDKDITDDEADALIDTADVIIDIIESYM